MQARILWVEGKRADSPPFVLGLRKKGYMVEVAASAKEALSRYPELDPDLIVLDVASMHSSGKRTAHQLKEQTNGIPILVIVDPQRSSGAELEANVVLSLPFTIRKLINRLAPLLPGDGANLLHVGPIRLDLERKRVRCQGRDATLTPRLAHLLRLFLEHPGEALRREHLFRAVWETEYTADTRTLDVHISWLRQALEENPHKPRFLKTIRGIGYRLDV